MFHTALSPPDMVPISMHNVAVGMVATRMDTHGSQSGPRGVCCSCILRQTTACTSPMLCVGIGFDWSWSGQTVRANYRGQLQCTAVLCGPSSGQPAAGSGSVSTVACGPGMQSIGVQMSGSFRQNSAQCQTVQTLPIWSNSNAAFFWGLRCTCSDYSDDCSGYASFAR
jgi:hypothetical protein